MGSWCTLLSPLWTLPYRTSLTTPTPSQAQLQPDESFSTYPASLQKIPRFKATAPVGLQTIPLHLWVYKQYRCTCGLQTIPLSSRLPTAHTLTVHYTTPRKQLTPSWGFTLISKRLARPLVNARLPSLYWLRRTHAPYSAGNWSLNHRPVWRSGQNSQ